MRKPHGVALFCDDIREEVGGKKTYVGVHSRVLELGSERPFHFPKLCVLSHVVIPSDFEPDTFTHQVVRIIADTTEIIGESTHELPARSGDTNKVFQAIVAGIFSPLEIDGPCELRVRVVYDGDNAVTLGALGIRFASGAPPEDTEPTEDA